MLWLKTYNKYKYQTIIIIHIKVEKMCGSISLKYIEKRKRWVRHFQSPVTETWSDHIQTQTWEPKRPCVLSSPCCWCRQWVTHHTAAATSSTHGKKLWMAAELRKVWEKIKIKICFVLKRKHSEIVSASPTCYQAFCCILAINKYGLVYKCCTPSPLRIDHNFNRATPDRTTPSLHCLSECWGFILSAEKGECGLLRQEEGGLRRQKDSALIEKR